MTRLILVRHGQTEWNRLGRIQGHTNVGLNDEGLIQARQVAAVIGDLAPTALWSSDLARAADTAAAIADATGLKTRFDPRLRERSFGELEGMSHVDFADRSPVEYAAFRIGDFDAVPAAESSASVAARTAEFSDALLDELGEEETAIVVGHGAALKILVGGLIGLAPEASVSILVGMGNCAWAEIEISPRSSRTGRLVAYNRGG